MDKLPDDPALWVEAQLSMAHLRMAVTVALIRRAEFITLWYRLVTIAKAGRE